MIDIVEKHRDRLLRSSLDLKSFLSRYEAYYLPIIDKYLPDYPTPKQVYEIADHLSEIFMASSEEVSRGSGDDNSEDQGNLSKAGIAWEALVVWTLNLHAYGSEVLVTRAGKERVPQVIRECLAVSHGNGPPDNTENDVIAFRVDPSRIPTEGSKLTYKALNVAAEDNPRAHLRVGLIQCKTNWNDNAQIPMAWNIIYEWARSSQTRNISDIRIGSAGKTPKTLEEFSYAFMTVPTVKNITQGSTAVRRVRMLSGGNYWGKRDEKDIANSLNQYFFNSKSNFGDDYFGGNLQNHIKNNLENDPDYVKRFKHLPILMLKEKEAKRAEKEAKRAERG